MHCVIMNTERSKGELVDHINHDTLDNRECNLRVVTNSENARNRNKLNVNNVSGERNVSLAKESNKWLVQLQVDGKNTCFGRFNYEDLDKAIELARQKRIELYGEI